MKIICKKTTSEGFDLNEVTTVFSNQFDYGRCGLRLQEEYVVMGMVIYEESNCLYYLVDIDGWPDWFPYLLFDVLDNSLPDDWFIKIIPRIEMRFVCMLCGFYELCNEEDFYSRLVDRDVGATSTYRKRKTEMEHKLGLHDHDE